MVCQINVANKTDTFFYFRTKIFANKAKLVCGKKMDYFLPISVIKIFSVWLPYHKPLFFAPYNKLCIFILSLSIGLHRQVGEEIENDFLATKLVNFLYKNATKRDL